MFTTKSLIFLSFILLSLHAQGVADPNEVLCAAADFPAICPAVYDPVCVPAPKQCFTTPCFQTETISNGCEACKTQGVQSYTLGKCQYTCDAGSLPPGILQTVDNPVCGSYAKDCQDASCRATFSSSTVACQDSGVVSFSLGACDDEGQGESEWNEEYVLEEENSFPDQNEVLCAAASFPEICPAVYDPVCVPAPKQCFTTPCFQTETLSNGCEACKTEGVLSYTPGRCQYACGPGNLPPGVAQNVVDPVCGSYIENCQEASCRATFSSSTVACQNPDVVQFSPGACDDEGDGNGNEECTLEEECTFEEENGWNNEESGSGDDIQYCTGDRPEICTFIYDPVCVVECVSGECRKTAGSACTACADPNVLGYIQGECEPKKIQCPDLSATDFACTQEYAPVCGYTNDCTDQSCGVTEGNACQACVFGGKDYYTEGACEDNGDGNSNEEECILEEENGLKKIQCPDLSATDFACTEEYAPVCGYTNDCTDESCGVTAGNGCQACVFGGKDYYTEGACGDNVL